MKKTKLLLTAFAVFASILMLMTTTMARPMQEKTNMDTVESMEQKLVNSLESLDAKLSKDVEANALLNSLARDGDVNSIIRNMQRAETEEAVLSGLEQLVIVLEYNEEFAGLENIIQENYAVESQTVVQQIETAFDSSVGTRGLGDIIKWILTLLQDIIEIIKNIITLLQSIWQLLKDLFGGAGDDEDGGDGGTPPL